MRRTSSSTGGTRDAALARSRNLSSWPLWFIVVVAGLAVAGGLGSHPVPTVGLVLGLIITAIGLMLPVRLQQAFLIFMAVLLAGYALFGRSFAHIGVSPLYVSEVVLVLGLAAMLPTAAVLPALRWPIVWIYFAFAIWGILRTVPFISVYGLDALRDAVLWGYGVFMILVGAALLKLGATMKALKLYRRFIPWLVLVVPFGMMISRLWELPMPGSDVPFNVKPGDYAVHLAGAGAFVVLGLHRRMESESFGSRFGGARDWMFWGAWLIGFAITSVFGRGGMLSILCAGAVLVFLGPGLKWARKLLRPIVVGVVLVALIALFNVRFQIEGSRPLSLDQISENIVSIFGRGSGHGLETTQNWRVNWWSDILDYTVGGPYFWTGKGYGINLERVDGYAATADFSSRAPHNATMDVLARSGVPGLVLWVLLMGTFAGMVVRAHWRARTRGDSLTARLYVWILAYWTAFMINGSFDTYLEGPQGGIWFWSLMGIGLALMEIQERAAVAERQDEGQRRQAKTRSKRTWPEPAGQRGF